MTGNGHRFPALGAVFLYRRPELGPAEVLKAMRADGCLLQFVIERGERRRVADRKFQISGVICGQAIGPRERQNLVTWFATGGESWMSARRVVNCRTSGWFKRFRRSPIM